MITPSPKLLSELLGDVPAQTNFQKSLSITGVTHNSRLAKPGALFIALRGAKQDGRSFIPQAIAAGAVAVMAEPPFEAPGAAAIAVQDIFPAMAQVAACFYEHPSHRMTVLGVTGTNGKTTITYLLEAILQKAGEPVGVLGTINYRFPGKTLNAPNTTPFATDLQETLFQMAQANVKTAIMEVSSHALAMHRVDMVSYDMAIFTNLTQDHLDYHKTMENYFQAKALLFQRFSQASSSKKNPVAVINQDDPYGRRLAEMTRAKIVFYGLSEEAAVRAESIVLESAGTKMSLVTPWGKAVLHLPLLGQYNVYNALAAVAAAGSLGVPLTTMVRALEEFPGVPGRLERVQEGQPFTVLVDYAHTEDALRRVLMTVREVPHKRLLTVFGCGGDRDRTKRPKMGQTATELSDWVIVTSDNPRTEDPGKIVQEVEQGIKEQGRANYSLVLDRHQAIEEALKRAQSGDIILLAGKGHETYQILKDSTIPFDDRKVARTLLRRLLKHAS